MRSSPAFQIIVTALAIGSSWLAVQQPSPAAAQISDVVVVAPKDPKVVATYPAIGSQVPGGPIVLKITFDQPMTPQAWSYTTSDKGQFPSCLARPRLLNDRRTFALLCSVAVNGKYALQINAAPDFVSTAGRSPPPFQLDFTTTDTLTNGLHDALSAAGLSDADDPIMGIAGASGAVQSAPNP